MPEFYEVLRGANIALGIAGFSWLIARVVEHWPQYTPALRLFLPVVLTYSMVTTEATAESLVLDTEPGPRVWLTLVANLALLVALAFSGKHPLARRDS